MVLEKPTQAHREKMKKETLARGEMDTPIIVARGKNNPQRIRKRNIFVEEAGTTRGCGLGTPTQAQYKRRISTN